MKKIIYKLEAWVSDNKDVVTQLVYKGFFYSQDSLEESGLRKMEGAVKRYKENNKDEK